MEIFKEPPLQKAPVFRTSRHASKHASTNAGVKPTERVDERRELSKDNRPNRSTKYGGSNSIDKEGGSADQERSRTARAKARENNYDNLKIPQGYTRDRNAEKFGMEHERVYQAPVPGSRSAYDRVYLSVGRGGVVLSNKHPKEQASERPKLNLIPDTDRVGDSVDDSVDSGAKSDSSRRAGTYVGHLGRPISQGTVYYTHQESGNNSRYYGDRPSFSTPISGVSDRYQRVVNTQDPKGSPNNARQDEQVERASAKVVGKLAEGKVEVKWSGWGG